MAAEYYIGQLFIGSYPPGAAIWCNANNAHIERQKGKAAKYKIVANPEPPVPTKDDIKQFRASAYQAEVDPITSHISRLRDKEQTAEIEAEISELIAERDAKVEEIKARFPYPTDPIYEESVEE